MIRTERAPTSQWQDLPRTALPLHQLQGTSERKPVDCNKSYKEPHEQRQTANNSVKSYTQMLVQ
jgi:hypothetical protein